MKKQIFILTLLAVGSFSIFYSCQKNSSIENGEKESLELFFNSYSNEGKKVAENIKNIIKDYRIIEIKDNANIYLQAFSDKNERQLKININSYDITKVNDYYNNLSLAHRSFLDDMKNAMKENTDDIDKKRKMEELISQIPNRIEESERDEVYNMASIIYHFPVQEVKWYINNNKNAKGWWGCDIMGDIVGNLVEQGTNCWICGAVASIVTEAVCDIISDIF